MDVKEFFQRYGGTRATGNESNAYASASPEYLRAQIETYEEMRRTCQKPNGGGRLTQGEFVEIGRSLVLMRSALLRRRA